jgi:hypothetical protein
MPVRIDYLRTCAGTQSFVHAGIFQWRTVTDRDLSLISLCRFEDFDAVRSIQIYKADMRISGSVTMMAEPVTVRACHETS